MICNKCNFENEENAKFCRKCGWELGKEIFNKKNNNQESNTQIDLLGVFGLIIVFLSLSSIILYGSYFMHSVLYFLTAGIPFAMSFFVKKKSIKIVLMILGIINVIFQVSYLF